MSNICYFEIPVEDMDKSQQFYRDLFHWQFEKLPGTPSEIDYHNIVTGSSEEPGVAFGGMMKKTESHPYHYALCQRAVY